MGSNFLYTTCSSRLGKSGDIQKLGYIGLTAPARSRVSQCICGPHAIASPRLTGRPTVRPRPRPMSEPSFRVEEKRLARAGGRRRFLTDNPLLLGASINDVSRIVGFFDRLPANLGHFFIPPPPVVRYRNPLSFLPFLLLLAVAPKFRNVRGSSCASF